VFLFLIGLSDPLVGWILVPQKTGNWSPPRGLAVLAMVLGPAFRAAFASRRISAGGNKLVTAQRLHRTCLDLSDYGPRQKIDVNRYSLHGILSQSAVRGFLGRGTAKS